MSVITEEIYKQAVQLYSDHVFRFMYKSCKDEELAKDVTQEAYFKLWQQKKEVDENKCKAWLFSTAHHLLLNDIRRRNTIIKNETKPDAHDHSHTRFELQDMIEKALEYLPQIQKSILLLRDLEGYSYDDIAEILKITEPQVKVYLFRARGKVKELLKNNMVFA